MANWTPDERAYLRDIMCIPRLFISSNSEFENVLDTINGLQTAVDDMGATQARIRTYMTEIASLDTKIDQNSKLMLATEVEDEVKFDAIRNMEGMRDYGRQLVGRISRQMGMLPRDDYFAGAPISAPQGDYISHDAFEVIVSSTISARKRVSRHKY